MVYNDLRSKLNEYNWDDGFEIPLSQVQKYKLQKKGISKIFLTDL